MEDLKYITASNIINLRTGAKMTQMELAEKLSYSDKSVSKWERAEAVPDAYVLKKMSEIFGVTVDYILSSHDQWEAPKKDTLMSKINTDVIISITMLGISTLSLLIFIVTWLFEKPLWIIFLYGLLVSNITLLVLQSVFKKGRYNTIIIAALIFVTIVTLFFTLLEFADVNFWQLFLLIIPGWFILFLTSRIKVKETVEK